MGEGLDKIAKSLLDLEPTAILDLFLVFPDPVKKPGTSYAIHNGANFKKGITWQGRDYMPMGMEIEGFEINADGRVNRPKIKISNKDYFITNLLRKNEDFKNARITRIRTFVKFLDDKNFDGGNPFGDPDSTAELSRQEYIVSQKVQENKIYVELELTSPLDLDNFEINSRRIMGKYCYWQYRGMGCQYKGVPVQKEDGSPFKDVNGNQMAIGDGFSFEDAQDEYNNSKDYTTGDLVFIKNSKVRIEDPGAVGVSRPLLNYYIAKTDVRGLSPDDNPQFWDKEGCNKKLSSCKLRFTEGKAVTRFVSQTQESRNVAKINSAGVSINFKPETESPFLQTLSGDGGWTIAYSFAKAPKYGSDQQTFYLSTNKTVYNGIEMTHYDNGNVDYHYFKNSAGSNSYLTVSSPTDGPSEGYHFVNRVTPNRTEFSSYNASTKQKVSSTNGISSNLTFDYFNVLAVDREANWNTVSMGGGRLQAEVEGVCFWDRTLSEEEIDLLYEKTENGGLVLRFYSYFKNSIIPAEQNILNGLIAWWDEPFELQDSTGFLDKSDSKNNLIYSGGNNAGEEFEKLYTYTYTVNKNVTTQEEVSYLPFGGFPGTDGFDFQRAT